MERELKDNDERLSELWSHYLFAIGIFIITYLSARIAETDYPDHLTFLPTKIDFLHPLAFFQKNVEPLWHYLTKLISWCLRIPVEYSGAIVSASCNLVLFELLRHFFYDYSKKYAAFISFITLTCAAFYIPWYNQYIYLGQSSPNVWHNPTIVMTRPFAFLVFLTSMKIMREPFLFSDYKAKVVTLVKLVLLIMFSAFAKPAFIQAFFPAIFFFCVGKTLMSKGKFLPNSVFLLICCLPTFVIVCLQFFISFFVKKGTTGGIGIQFLYVMKIWAPNPFISVLLAIIFPLCVVLIKLIQKSKFSDMLIFSWVMLFCALVEKMFLVETARPSHGNFGWAYSISLFLLFISSIAEYLQIIKDINKEVIQRPRNWYLYNICSVALFIHFAIGLIYIYRVIFLHTYA